MLDKEALSNGAEGYRWLLDALEEKSGEDVVLMDLSSVGALSDVFVLVTGNSEVHMKTLMDAAEEALERHGLPCRLEGETSSNWRLVDAGNVVVHVFSRKGRDFYRLERLWGDAETLSRGPLEADGSMDFEASEL